MAREFKPGEGIFLPDTARCPGGWSQRVGVLMGSVGEESRRVQESAAQCCFPDACADAAARGRGAYGGRPLGSRVRRWCAAPFGTATLALPPDLQGLHRPRAARIDVTRAAVACDGVPTGCLRGGAASDLGGLVDYAVLGTFVLAGSEG